MRVCACVCVMAQGRENERVALTDKIELKCVSPRQVSGEVQVPGLGAKFWVSRSRWPICPFQSLFAAVKEHEAAC